MSVSNRCCLLVDADDTLWENHRYFIEVFSRFLSLMEMRGHDRESVGRMVRDTEADRTQSRGYGSRSFALNLIEVAQILEPAVDQTLQQVIQNEGEWIFHHPVEVFPGVAATLSQLKERHELRLVTKGSLEEQVAKVHRSGLQENFASTHVLREKNIETYRELIATEGLDRQHTWMIGNSPKSDMNPAHGAGLRTVFIPHRTIWELEDSALDPLPDLQLKRFKDLLQHF